MKERINMNTKELSRLKELNKVHDKRQTIVEAAEHLRLGERQVKRLSKRLEVEGTKRLISKQVGKRSNHQMPKGLKEFALGFIQENYLDFGPTLAHEYLTEQHQLPLSVSRVRNITPFQLRSATKSTSALR